MTKRHLFIPFLVSAILCVACDDPPTKNYQYQEDLAGEAPTISESFQGTYLVKNYSKAFSGKPFALSISATDYQEANEAQARLTPWNEVAQGETHDATFRGTYSATTTGSITKATLTFTDRHEGKEGEAIIKETGRMDFSSFVFPTSPSDSFAIFTFTDAKGNSFRGDKIDDLVIQMEKKDKHYYGTSKFLANADEDYGDGISWQFSNAEKNGFYFPNASQVCIRGIKDPAGNVLKDGLYDYQIISNRLYLYTHKALKHEYDPIAVFHYFITRAPDGGYADPHYLWVNGQWYRKVNRT